MRCERTMREVRLNAGKQQGSAPRAVDWPVRSPATFTRCDLSLSKTPNGAILPQNHLESGECRVNKLAVSIWEFAVANRTDMRKSHTGDLTYCLGQEVATFSQ